MKLSTKGRYGVRALVDISLHYKEKPVPMKDIAQRQELSEKYLEQVLVILKKAGIISSVLGNRGGYVLNDEPQNIFVYDVLNVLEGEISIVEENRKTSLNERFQLFLNKNVWTPVNTKTHKLLKSITLFDLQEEGKSGGEKYEQ